MCVYVCVKNTIQDARGEEFYHGWVDVFIPLVGVAEVGQCASDLKFGSCFHIRKLNN